MAVAVFYEKFVFFAGALSSGEGTDKALKRDKNGVFGKKRVLIETFGRNPSRSVVENANAHKTTNF